MRFYNLSKERLTQSQIDEVRLNYNGEYTELTEEINNEFKKLLTFNEPPNMIQLSKKSEEIVDLLTKYKVKLVNLDVPHFFSPELETLLIMSGINVLYSFKKNNEHHSFIIKTLTN